MKALVMKRCVVLPAAVLVMLVIFCLAPGTVTAAPNGEGSAGKLIQQMENDAELGAEMLVSPQDNELKADGHGKANADGDDPDLLSLHPGTYIWQLIIFLVVFSILAKFVWPVILKGVTDRERKMRRDLTEAQNAAAEAKATLAQYKSQLAEAQKEAQRIIEQSRKDAEKVAAKVKADTENDIQNMKHRAQADIENAKNQAVKEVFDQAADLSTRIAGQILEREINPDDHRQLVQASLNQLERN